jgi:hypothetical protein
LNGVEIHRFNIAAGAVLSTTLGIDHENAYSGPYLVPSSSLVRGDNVLAVEVHNVAATSSDTVMGAELLQVTLTNVPATAIASLTPSANAANAATNANIEIILTDGTRQVATNSIQLSVNGQVVTPTISKPAEGISTTITYDPPVDFAPDATVTVRLTYSDDATPAKVNVTDYTFHVEPTFNVVFAIDDNKTWRYENTGKNLGTAWKEKTFNDSAWPEGPALLAFETGATAEPIRTQLVRQDPDGVQIITDYFRSHFTFTGNPATARLRIRHVVDDAVALYLNGVEVYRFFLPATGPIVWDTVATPSDHENKYEGPFDIPVTGLVAGDNVLAAEVHQNAATSSDVVFGLELLVGVASAPPVEAKFTKVSQSSGNIQIEWSGTGTLQSASTVLGPWTDVLNSSTPFTASTAGTAKFYRLKQ